MKILKLKNIKIYGLATVLLLVLVGIIGFIGYQPEADAVDNFNPAGTWKVTEVTGSVNEKVKGGSAWCDAKDENYYPIIDDDQTYIKFIDGSKKSKLKNIPRTVYDTLNIMKNEKGIFIFQFSFDNGPESNKVLESYRVPYHYTEIIKGLWTFEVGYWGNTKELEGTQIGKLSNAYAEGIVAEGEIISGNKWGGRNSLRVVGHLKSDNRIEGFWVWDGNTAGPINIPECTSKLEGSGKWVAEKI